MRNQTETVTQTVPQMCDVLQAAKPGDTLEIVFANKTFNGDLKGRVTMLMYFFKPGSGTLRLPEGSYFNLLGVALSGLWYGFRTYTATVCEGYDATQFINRTIGREMLQSVTKV